MHTRMHHTHTHTHTTWHDTTPHTHTNTHTYPPNPPTWHMMPIVSDDSLVCDGLMSDKRHLVLSCADGVGLVGDVSSISVDGNLHRAFTRRTSIHCAGRLQKSESNVKAKSKRNTTVWRGSFFAELCLPTQWPHCWKLSQVSLGWQRPD